MHKGKVTLIGLLLCLSLLAMSALTALADGAEKESVEIASVEDFLSFADNCRLDSYSEDLTVTLETDIDLTGVDFTGIPIFSGIFEGQGHSIKGLTLTEKGSVQGLFRYLEQDAIVRDLSVYGEIIPKGSRSIVGGIAGSNAGEIQNCSFFGNVSGADSVGGIAGRNEVTGLIENGYVEGNIHGNHFVGGIAGENLGVIRRSTNHGGINTTSSQNTVDISDITLDTLTGSELAATVTDIGGIAGLSGGVIRDCINHGSVGYSHMGYNIGGIVGSQTGYVSGCTNYGEITGRKEVGGIVGQMEPASLIEYEKDTLQILQQQLITMGEIIDRTKSNTESNSTAINNQIGVIRGLVSDAQAALDLLMREVAAMGDQESGEKEPLDMDQFSAALNTLMTSMNGMRNAVQRLLNLTQSAGITLKNDLDALNNQMDAISNTLDGASDNLGGSITDVSDGDTEDDLTCKVETCVNRGSVAADINAGGIAGAIAPENDLDPEDDLEISGELSLNFSGEYRAVIMNCSNHGTVTVKRQRTGGIVGWMALGLVKDSQNTGVIDGVNADFVGGIAGESGGYIRGCDVKCQVTGVDNVGGIAGTGAVVSDCRSMVLITGEEKVGAVLGYTDQPMTQETERQVTNNVYLSVGSDIGAIDGISYNKAAEPMVREDFLGLEGLPEYFAKVNVRFVGQDGFEEMITVETGDHIALDQIPAVPEREGYVGHWEGVDGTRPDAELFSDILFDMTFEAVYVSEVSVIRSEQTDEKGLPLLLAEGVFRDEKQLQLKELEKEPELLEGEALIAGWEILLPAKGESTTMRYLIPEEYRGKELKLMVRLTGRVWNEEPFTVDGSYMVFSADAEDDAFCLVKEATDYRMVWYGAGGAAVGALVILWHWIGKRNKKRK